jgi:phosphatidylserine/phosphatidylglycerophosphate/cardiolipin synthase-like enzyme
MRIRVKTEGLSVRAIAGTHVVLFGLDMPKDRAKRLLGFGFERVDDETGDRRPLLGLKTFAETEPADHEPGTAVSTLEHPIQAFLWGDYTAEPGREYSYRVVAFGGTPADLQPLAQVVVPVRTEHGDLGKHGIYFNRGAAASQAYRNQFENRRPRDVPDRAAWIWLSRGLDEGIRRFIDRALPGDALRAALYEFKYDAVLAALAAARDRGVDVRIVMDAKRNQRMDERTGERHDVPREDNIEAVDRVGLANEVRRREANPSFIAHNKFIVHLRDGQPIAVWTGSTNITAGGIFGHSNVGHAVRDPAVAARYFDYWLRIGDDPTAAAVRPYTELSPIPPFNPPRGITPIFSPRASLAALDWYASLMGRARKSVFLTAAFGVSEQLRNVLAVDVDYLRYGLLDKRDGRVELLKRDRDNVFAVGARIANAIGGWAEETLTGLNGHVQYVHTKFMLIDPLSWDPIVITGSANFSEPSTRENDENMLVIRGSTRVADIYLTEFMRLFNHFEFRNRVAAGDAEGTGPQLAGGVPSAAAEGLAAMPTGEPTTGGFRHLDPVPGWALEHYVPGWRRTKERLLFR